MQAQRPPVFSILRNNAKNNKNYDLADSIRNKLNDMNVVIKDTREGTVFE